MEKGASPAGPMRAATAGLVPYNAGLSADLVRERFGLAEIVKLASNENPFGAAPAVRSALAAALGQVAIYPDPYCTALRKAISAAVGIDPARMVFGNGSEDLLGVTCRAFLDPGEAIVISSPTFSVYADSAAVMGARVIDVPRLPDLSLDVDAVCNAVAAGPKILFLCNPNNPTGNMIGRAAFEKICRVAGAATLIVADEAYYEYALSDPDYPDSLAFLSSTGSSWLIFRTFSKAYGLAGLRMGYGLASSPEIARQIDMVRTAFNVNHLAQAAALAAWGDPGHVTRTAAHNRVEVARLAGALRERGFDPAPSAANFLFFNLKRNARACADGLLAHGVIVKPWGGAHADCMRVTIGSTRDNDAFLAAFDQVLRA